MKAFNYTNAKTLAEAKNILVGRKAMLIAGGTDLVVQLKDNILPTYPTTLINIKTIIPGLDYTKEEAAGIAAVEDAMPFPATKYKVRIAKTLVKQALPATV